MSKLNIDMKALSQMAELLNEAGLNEIEWEEGDIKVRLSKGAEHVTTVAAAPSPMAVAAAPVSVAPAPAGDGRAAVSGDAVLSPMVGTVYLSPEPDAAAFVKVGDTVAPGQTVMIVEAMKTMNAVPAPRAGKVVDILVSNEQPVEFDQPLLVLE